MKMIRPMVQCLRPSLQPSTSAHGWKRNELTPKRPLSGSARQKRNERIKQRDQYTCQMCGCLRISKDLEIDHKVPISEGGSEDDSNLQSLCASPCHAKKTAAESARGVPRGVW
jgi:5-methylcytosine-specific restriction protein A